jgi:cold shock CspA family protein
MQVPAQITYRGFEPRAALEADVRERIAWLEQFYGGIVRCRVLVELPHRHRHDGRHFHVRIELTVPGGEPIVVTHEPSLHGPLKDVAAEAHRKQAELEGVHEHARAAVHDAFDAARRRLQDFARRQRGAVKAHEPPDHGIVAEIRADEGYGFIETGERRIYFSRASVLDDGFDELAVGSPVAYVEEMGEKGPQASTVRVLGTHHYAKAP